MNKVDNATFLRDIADLVSFYHRLEEGKVITEVQDHLRSAIVCGLNEFLAGFKLISSGNLKKVQDDLVEEQTLKEEKSEPEPEQQEEEQPKRRVRKKKVVEQLKEEAPTTAPTTAPTIALTITHRELRFKEGLDKEVASFSTIEDVDDDKIVNENLGPIPLANSLLKQGEHPFFKGPAQFVWYLDMDRWPLYLADLLETTEFYPDQLSLYDSKRLEEAKRVGVDIEFVTAILNKETRNMVSIEDFKESEYATCDEGEDALMELKESGFLKKFVHDIDPERKLIKFLCRNGRNKRIGDDLTKIYEEHTEHPNKYIHW